MATYYGINTGSLNWATANSWNTASNQATGNAPNAPLVTDTVILDSHSANMAVNTGSCVCAALTMTGYANTFTIPSDNQLSVSGNVTLPAGGTLAGTGTLALQAAGTLTVNGQQIPWNLNFNVAVTYILSNSGNTVVVNGLVTNNSAATVLNWTTTETLTCNGGFSANNSSISGTAPILWAGGTCGSTASSYYVSNPVQLAGNFTAAPIIATKGNITYVSGTPNFATNSNTWYLGAPCTMSIPAASAHLYNLTQATSTITLTLTVPLYLDGVLLSGATSILTFATNGITCNGITISNQYGFAGQSITVVGGTVAGNGTGVIATNLNLSNCTVTGTIYYSTGTLTTGSGVTASAAKLVCQTTAPTLNIANTTWNEIDCNVSYTLMGNLNANIIDSYGNAVVVQTGNYGLNCNWLYDSDGNGANGGWTFPAGISINVAQGFMANGTVNPLFTGTWKSATPGSPVYLNYGGTAVNQTIFDMIFTDINCSGSAVTLENYCGTVNGVTTNMGVYTLSALSVPTAAQNAAAILAALPDGTHSLAAMLTSLYGGGQTIAQQVWNALTSANTAAGSVGLAINNQYSYWTQTLANNLATTNTTIAGWVTNGMGLTAAALATIQGYIPVATAIATSVWGNATRTLSAFGFTVATNSDSNVTAIKAKTDNLPVSPMAAGNVTVGAYATGQDPVTLINAGTGRVANLDNADAAISSRLATSGYTAPDNTDVQAIKALMPTTVIAAKSDLPAVPTAVQNRQEMDSNSTRLAHLQADITSTPLAASAYVAPLNASITQILNSLTTYLTTAPTDANLEDWANQIIVDIEALPNNSAEIASIETIASDILAAVDNAQTAATAAQQYASLMAAITTAINAASAAAQPAEVTAALTAYGTAKTTDVTGLAIPNAAAITTAAQTALTNQGLTTTQVSALSAFLAAYASSLATQTQATSILSAIAALPAPSNSTISSIWGEVQTILTGVTSSTATIAEAIANIPVPTIPVGIALEADVLAALVGIQALQRGLLGSVYLQVAPSSVPGSMILTFDTGITGLTGTVGFTVYDASGDIVQARTTGTVPCPIMEMPAGSGVYYCVVPYSLILGNMVVWDTGGDTPLSASEAFPSDLVGLIAGGPKAKTLREIANLAVNTYPGWNRDDEMSPLLYAEDGWRQFVHIGGNLYTNTAILTTVAGQAIYSLPADFRLITDRHAVAIQATPQYLAEISAQQAMADPNWQNVLGTPSAFFFPDPMHIGLSPTPAANGVAITIRYDAEAPSPMPYDAPLPMPALYEHALFGYARSHMAETMGNDRLAAIEYNKFKELLATWKAGKQTRMVAPSQATPYTTRPNGLARSAGGYEEER